MHIPVEMPRHPMLPLLGHFLPFVLLLLGFFPFPISGLQCYSGQTQMTAALPASSQCSNVSFSCTKSIDWTNQIVLRQCQTGNCTYPNQTTIAQPGGCWNSSTNTQTYCCCYSDGCNRASQIHNGSAFSIFALISVIGAFISFFWL